MGIRSKLVLTVMILAALSACARGSEYKKEAGPHAVRETTHDWRDATRDREVPVKIYSPRSNVGSFPVIIFSHGLGGSRDGYAYVGRHWASHGYVVVHVQHKGSDDGVWRDADRPMEAMRGAVGDPKNALNRPKDVSFVIDQMEVMDREKGPLQRRLDLKRIGMAGHSFGAFTTLAISGQRLIGPRDGEVTLADDRVSAAIAMSASAPKRRKDLVARTYGAIRVPCFHMTGTLDDSPINNSVAADRRIPFDNMNASDQYLLTFEGGDHRAFSGRNVRTGREKDPIFHDIIRMSSTAFWDAYLRSDPRAKAWLAEGPFQTLLTRHGTLEIKLRH